MMKASSRVRGVVKVSTPLVLIGPVPLSDSSGQTIGPDQNTLLRCLDGEPGSDPDLDWVLKVLFRWF